MRKLLLRISLLIVILLVLTTAITGQEPDKELTLTILTLQRLQSWHYNPLPIDDQFSRRVFQLYLKGLDYNKRFLLLTDIEELQSYEFKIDDQLKQGQNAFFELATNLLQKRITLAQSMVAELTAQPFDLTSSETLELDPEKRQYCRDQAGLRELWRKILKYQILQRYLEILNTREKDGGPKLTLEQKQQLQPEIEKEAREAVAKSTNRSLQRLLQESRSNRFEKYLNAIANSYDPHTTYFSPQSAENFNIDLNGTVEGIGVMISEEGDFIKVESVVPGGPAWRQKELKAGDLILKAAQGNGEAVDLSNMSSNEAVRLIRGKKGSEVRLTVQKPDGRIVIVPLIRDVVVLEETYAKTAVVTNTKNGKKIGYIYLPSFYRDQKTKRNAAVDVKKALLRLNAEKVDGIIFDLRDNGGGNLVDAIDITGFFIDRGPILQVKDGLNRQEVYKDPNPGVVYHGPLVVMINSLSASASEIFAAAMQDYKRAVILGGPTSFGKGTVQSLVDLDQQVTKDLNYLKPLGSLKLTTQKFYRVTGESTQFQGVKADLPLPDLYSYAKIGEKNLDYPLAWDKAVPSEYQQWEDQPNLKTLAQESAQRITSTNSFKLINQEIARVRKQREVTSEDLSLAGFIAAQLAKQAEAEQMKNNQSEISDLKVKLSLGNAKDKDPAWKASNDEWLNKLKRDVYLEEATMVIGNILGF